MNIDQIRCVLSVAKYGSFTEASAHLPFAQSSISKKIAVLEKELDVSLFDRTTREVVLTQAGKRFVARGEEMLRIHAALMADLHGHRPERPRLVIGSIYFAPDQSISPYVALFSFDHPSTEIETIYGTTTPLIEGLLEGAVDVALVSSMYTEGDEETPHNFTADDRFLAASLAIDPYYLVVSECHRFAGREIVDYGDIRNEKLISLGKSMDVYHRALDCVLREEGITPNVKIKSGSVQEALLLVSQNLGVAILSSKVASNREGVRLIRMRRPLLRDTQIVIRNEKRIAPQIRSFYQYMKDNYR